MWFSFIESIWRIRAEKSTSWWFLSRKPFYTSYWFFDSEQTPNFTITSCEVIKRKWFSCSFGLWYFVRRKILFYKKTVNAILILKTFWNIFDNLTSFKILSFNTRKDEIRHFARIFELEEKAQSNLHIARALWNIEIWRQYLHRNTFVETFVIGFDSSQTASNWLMKSVQRLEQTRNARVHLKRKETVLKTRALLFVAESLGKLFPDIQWFSQINWIVESKISRFLLSAIMWVRTKVWLWKNSTSGSVVISCFLEFLSVIFFDLIMTLIL